MGYFYKVQGYISQQQQLDFEASPRTKKPVPLKAPLIVGRLIWVADPITTTAADNTPVWVLASAGGIGIILIVGWVIWSSRRKRPSPVSRTTTTSLIDPDAPEVDSGLDQAQSGRFSLDPIPESAAYSEGIARDRGGSNFCLGDRFPGNILGENGESTMGDRAKNGNSSNEGNHYPNGSTGHSRKSVRMTAQTISKGKCSWQTRPQIQCRLKAKSNLSRKRCPNASWTGSARSLFGMPAASRSTSLGFHFCS